jgi:hypothetical protein
VRTVVIGSNGNGDGAVSHPEVLRLPSPFEDSHRTRRAKEPRSGQKKARRQKDFIIQYDRKFIGHFRARSPLEPKEAFARIGEEMAKTIQDFRPELLALFQPVRLRTGKPAGKAEGSGGELIWFKQ